MPDKWESTSKNDRGVVHVETIGYNQEGKVVCIFRRKAMDGAQAELLHRAWWRAARPSNPVPDTRARHDHLTPKGRQHRFG